MKRAIVDIWYSNWVIASDSLGFMTLKSGEDQHAVFVCHLDGHLVWPSIKSKYFCPGTNGIFSWKKNPFNTFLVLLWHLILDFSHSLFLIRNVDKCKCWAVIYVQCQAPTLRIKINVEILCSETNSSKMTLDHWKRRVTFVSVVTFSRPV